MSSAGIYFGRNTGVRDFRGGYMQFIFFIVPVLPAKL